MPWRHRKTGGLYDVVGSALDERTERPLVLYRSLEDGRTWARDAEQFHDGRFVDLSTWRPEDTWVLIDELYPPEAPNPLEAVRVALVAAGEAAGRAAPGLYLAGARGHNPWKEATL